MENFKKIIKNFLYDESILNNFSNNFSCHKILLIGDGISQRVLSRIIDKYKYIACVNTSILRSLINKKELLFYTLIDPSLFLPKKIRKILVPKKWPDSYNYNELLFKYSQNSNINYRIYHPLGNLFTSRKIKKNFNYVFLKIGCNHLKIREFKYKKSFVSGSFDASLYTALKLGFTKIDLIGFDSFALKENVHLRWYEPKINSDIQDHIISRINHKKNISKFLQESLNIAAIRTYHCNDQNPITSKIKGINLNLDFSELLNINCIDELKDDKCIHLIKKYNKRLVTDFIEQYY